MTPIEVSFDEETLREVLLGDKGAEVLLEKITNEVLQAEMTEHLGAEPGERPCFGASAKSLKDRPTFVPNG